jgi:hypothetical protein
VSAYEPDEPDYPGLDLLSDVRDDMFFRLVNAIDEREPALPFSMHDASTWAKEATDLVYERFVAACDRAAGAALGGE